MNNLECSSECESGWTMYLEHSSVSLNPCKSNGQFSNYNQKVMKEVFDVVIEEEEEDLSMVSDASSGPAHFLEHEDYYTENQNFFASSSSLKNRSSKRQKKIKQKISSDSLLGDTASSPMSPIYSFSKNSNFTFTNKKVSIDNLLGFSQDFITTTHLKEKSTLGKSFGSLPGKYLKQNQ
ncbi:hypothetical protein MKX01_019428 [Papaver californicum]|nr:hypothetical protein MKX01_019428 [Papaver californicum]